MAIADSIKTAEFKTEKHVPAIEIVTKEDTTYTIAVIVGKEIAHPNTTAHFISYIALFYKADGDNFIQDLGKAEFSAHGASVEGADKGSAYTDSCAVFKAKLAKAGTLTAVSYCNIHGLWESELKI